MRIECKNCGKVIEGRGTLLYCSGTCAKEYKPKRKPEEIKKRAVIIREVSKDYFDWNAYDNQIII